MRLLKNTPNASPNASRKASWNVSRKTQKRLTLIAGTLLTALCCLLAERYAGRSAGRSGETDGSTAVSTAVSNAVSNAVSTAAAANPFTEARPSGNLLILSYPQVLPDTVSASEEGTLPLSTFKEDLSYLAENAAFVLPEEVKQASQGLFSLPEKAVMLTFDGYESFYTVVWPQLRESGGKGCVGVLGEEADLYANLYSGERSSDSPDITQESRLSWEQIVQMDRSDCVSIGSRGYRLYPEEEKLEKGLSFWMKWTGLSKKKSENRLSEYLAFAGEDALVMGERMREKLYHEAEAVFVPRGCGGEETDRILTQTGAVMTLLDGEPGDWSDFVNPITGRESLMSLRCLSRSESGSLSEQIGGYFDQK